MDLVFNALPDVFSYQSLRHSTYDAPWLNDSASNKGKRSPQPQQQRRPLQQQQSATAQTQRRSSGGSGCESCPLCLEKQRRPLATYIRSKSRQDRREDASIQEEAEDEVEEQEQEREGEEERAKEAVEGAPALGAAHA